jgi:hypothetical protein
MRVYMLTGERFTRQYDKLGNPLPLQLPPGKKEHVFGFHDKMAAHANDKPLTCWTRDDQHVLRQKSKGKLLHAADFIWEGKYARLRIPGEPPSDLTDSRRIIYPGKNADPYWDGAQLIKQVKETIPLFERLYPGCVGVFNFDQSSAHGAYAPDALNAKNVNVGPGGKQAEMHATITLNTNPHPYLRGMHQEMVFSPNHPLYPNQPKGMEVVLKERGLYDSIQLGLRGKPLGDCQTCKRAVKSREAAAKRL